MEIIFNNQAPSKIILEEAGGLVDKLRITRYMDGELISEESIKKIDVENTLLLDIVKRISDRISDSKI